MPRSIETNAAMGQHRRQAPCWAFPAFLPLAVGRRLLLFTLPMSAIELSERFLMDAGGWQAMKHARALVEMGRVVSFNYTPPVLKGLVREGTIEYRAGLKIRTGTDIENPKHLSSQNLTASIEGAMVERLGTIRSR